MPSMPTPSGVALIQREAAGSDAPIRNVGGSRQRPLTRARSRIAGRPCPTADVYTESTSGIRNSTRIPQAPIPSSSLQQAEAAHQGAQQNRRQAVPHRGRVYGIHQRHQEQHQNSAGADTEFQLAVDAQRILPAELQAA